MFNYHSIKIFFIFVIISLVFGFQNCSDGFLGKNESQKSGRGFENAASGNGGTYDGKIYVNLNPLCPGDSNIKTKIIVGSDNSPYIVRENCEDIAPKAVSVDEVGLLAHNLSNLVYQNRAFDEVLDIEKPTVWICRGSETKTFIEGAFKFVVDGIIRSSPASAMSEQLFFGQVKFGLYDSKQIMIESHQSEQFALNRVPMPDSTFTFTGANISKSEQIDLAFRFNGSDYAGVLSYLFQSPLLNSQTPTPRPIADPGALPPLLSIKDMTRFVTSVECFQP